MLNNMGSSSVLRRWMSRAPQIFFKSRGISSLESAPAPAPWLMMTPDHDTQGGSVFRFYCYAENKVYSFLHDEHNRGPNINFGSAIGRWLEVVGSSCGWLALHDNKNREALFLFDPTTYRHIKLPPLMRLWGEEVRSVILDEREGKAFMSFGSGSGDWLAFCSPGRSHEWTLFDSKGGSYSYESVVYSSVHRRLFCITSASVLEAWDVEGDYPVPDPVINIDIPEWDQPDLRKLKYIVCAEHSGDLFMVVRHMKLGGRTWPPTVDFEVYRMYRKEQLMMRMADSLEGLAIFVGMNHPIAIKAKDVGLHPNSVYFTYDHRLCYSSSRDSGSFDYKTGVVSSLNTYHQASEPVWFTPRLHNI